MIIGDEEYDDEFVKMFMKAVQDGPSDWSDDFYTEMSTWTIDDVAKFSELCARLRDAMASRYEEEILLMHPDAIEEGDSANDCFWNVAAGSDPIDMMQATMVINSAAISAEDIFKKETES